MPGDGQNRPRAAGEEDELISPPTRMMAADRATSSSTLPPDVAHVTRVEGPNQAVDGSQLPLIH